MIQHNTETRPTGRISQESEQACDDKQEKAGEETKNRRGREVKSYTRKY
jgi:hypothetical protein